MKKQITKFTQPQVEKSKTPKQNTFQQVLSYNQSNRSFDTNQNYSKLKKKSIL
jgi:hypothetical protein